VIVHAGIYRERVNPPRGGTSEKQRIVYQAASGEVVEIKGSELVTGWTRVEGDVWTVSLPNSFFGDFNPYSDLIRGDWFEPKGRSHHTGAVYWNGEWLREAATQEEVLHAPKDGASGGGLLWFAHVGQVNTTLWARFPGGNPNEHRVEINVRKTVFYPDKPGRDYITVRGFEMRHAATPWAPPTAEQIGLLGTHWSKGWIVENNVISHSVCSGIALGKHGDAWDNTSANSAEGYVKTIERALTNGWQRDRIGHHIVRNNTISHCEQAGIVGSLGAAFSSVTGNTIHDIHVRRLFTGAEMAGIKFHGAIDTVISGNHIHHTCLGLWLDWMAQGTRVTGNLFHDNAGQDLFVEVNHGPFMVDNNLFLSAVNLLDMSEGGAFAHNLFRGKLISRPELSRETPFHPAHGTAVAGLARIRGGDHRFLNNIFVGPGAGDPAAEVDPKKDPEWKGGYGLWVYDFREEPIQTSGNFYVGHARPYSREVSGTIAPEGPSPSVKLEPRKDNWILHAPLDPTAAKSVTSLVTTEVLGLAKVPSLKYENADGSVLRLDRDYRGRRRSRSHPTPGPFEDAGNGTVSWEVR